MSSIPKNWSTTSLSENWKFGRNSWVEILVRSFTVLNAHEMREGKCILVSILMRGLRKSELYLAWLLWQLALPSDWAEFCYKWMSQIQISSTLRRPRRQSGLMTEGIPHGWNQRAQEQCNWTLYLHGTESLQDTWSRPGGNMRIYNGAFPTMFSWTAMILGPAKC